MQINRCLNCMAEMGDATVCPHCGYDPSQSQEVPYSLRPGSILHGKYLVGRMLGQGGFGITYVGFDLALELKVAIKEYFPLNQLSRDQSKSNEVHWNTTHEQSGQWQSGCESFLKEARKMAKISTVPGVVRVRETFNENNTAYIVMDFAEGVTLRKWLERRGTLSMAEAIQLLTPLMESVATMHELGMIHRDISPDNIMVQPNGSLCLLDFGAAKDLTVRSGMSSELVAKTGFSPLEQYMQRGGTGTWTDVYALTATLYYCVTGVIPPKAVDRLDRDGLDLTLLRMTPVPLQRAIQHGLAVQPKERIQTVPALLQALQLSPVPKPAAPKWLLPVILGGAALVLLVILAIYFHGNKHDPIIREDDDTIVTEEDTTSELGSLPAPSELLSAPSVSALGANSSNAALGSTYMFFGDSQYEFYIDSFGNLCRCPYDEEEGSFYLNVYDIIDSEATSMVASETHIYFLHAEPDHFSIQGMEVDGDTPQTLYSDSYIQMLQYAALDDDTAYLYFLTRENPTAQTGKLMRLNLETGDCETAPGEYNWYTLIEDRIYCAQVTDADDLAVDLYALTLDFAGGEPLVEDMGLFYGLYDEEETLFMYSNVEECVIAYDLEGNQQEHPLDDLGTTLYQSLNVVIASGRMYYYDPETTTLNCVDLDGENSIELTSGYDIGLINYDGGWVWFMASEDDGLTWKTYLVQRDGERIIDLESNLTETGLMYQLNGDGTFDIIGYQGDDEAVGIPWFIGDAEINEIVSDSGWWYTYPDCYLEIHPSELTYEEGETGVIITGYDGHLTGDKDELALPGRLDGKLVTGIGDYAFRGNENIRTLVLPPHLQSLSLGALMDTDIDHLVLPRKLETVQGNPLCMTDLQSVSISPWNETFFVEDGCLYQNLTSGVYLRSCLSSSATEVTIRADTEIIGVNAFSFCSPRELVLPDGLREIGHSAFLGCENLERVVIPESVTEIYSSAFERCPLTEVTISQDCTVGEKAFDEDVEIHYYR